MLFRACLYSHVCGFCVHDGGVVIFYPIQKQIVLVEYNAKLHVYLYSVQNHTFVFFIQQLEIAEFEIYIDNFTRNIAGVRICEFWFQDNDGYINSDGHRNLGQFALCFKSFKDQ